MSVRIAWSLGAILIVFSSAYADVLVRAQTVQAGKVVPVANAKVLIEPKSKNGKIIQEGKTDAKGEFNATNLPGNHGEISITIYPSDETGLDSKTKDFSPKEKDTITIRLKQKRR
jgi:hypothetical protein